ncbi:unnamed protein product, partial [Phaeothamnion confervicola]
MWQLVDAKKDRAQHGVKVCKAMAAFLQERSSVEQAYGDALSRASKRALANKTSSTWAPQLVGGGWAPMVECARLLGGQHAALAVMGAADVSRALLTVTTQQAAQVGRLSSEAQALLQGMEATQTRYFHAKAGYERACMDASRLIHSRDRAKAAAGAPPPPPSLLAPSPGRARTAEPRPPAMLPQLPPLPLQQQQQNVAAEASILPPAPPMTATAPAAAAPAQASVLSNLEERVGAALTRVDAAEDAYVEQVMAMNAACAELRPQMDAKLGEFQLAEEARAGSLRAPLLR